MSCFLCLSVPPEAASNLRHSFDPIIHLTEASLWPIGQAARGKNKQWPSYFLQVGSSSAKLVGPFPARRTHNNDRSDLLVSGLQSLLAAVACPSVTFLFHWFKGCLQTETIPLKDERTVGLTDLARSIYDLDEDVRYVVHL
jgi:hypothetical protein